MTTPADLNERADELSPCPFCGNTDLQILSNGIGDYYVICDASDEDMPSCGARISDSRCETQAQAARRWNLRPAAYEAGLAAMDTFQARVHPWMMECFGPEISADNVERDDRFLEEALELGQARTQTRERAHQLVDYVYDRPKGEPAQEVGGVMVTLAALCLAGGLDMHKCGEVELARIWGKMQQIRAKQAAKPKGSPLPQAPARPALSREEVAGHHKLDNDRQVFFYEQDFYVLSNFSAFSLRWANRRFDTSEAAYHSEKFPGDSQLRASIQAAPSAHEAFKIAEAHKAERRPDWDRVKVNIMRSILQAKAGQHEYVRRKLLATGDRELIEDSWRDDFWGWGPNRDGQNMLGKLWMEVRAELLAALGGQT